MHRCPNNDCPSRGLESLNNWVMGAADIEGVGSSSSAAWDLGLLRSILDLYRITKEQLAELDGYADISAQNAVDAIAASKDIAFARVLAGLNIPDVGWVTAQPRAPLRVHRPAARRGAGGHRGGRGHRPRPRGVHRHLVRTRRTARWSRSSASSDPPRSQTSARSRARSPATST